MTLAWAEHFTLGIALPERGQPLSCSHVLRREGPRNQQYVSASVDGDQELKFAAGTVRIPLRAVCPGRTGARVLSRSCPHRLQHVAVQRIAVSASSLCVSLGVLHRRKSIHPRRHNNCHSCCTDLEILRDASSGCEEFGALSKLLRPSCQTLFASIVDTGFVWPN
jgi:hypothetical protein